MTKDATPDKARQMPDGTAPRAAGEVRYGNGPRTLASLLPAITRPAFRRRSPASVSIMSDWSALAGPAVAAMATPRRFHGGTLTLAANGPAAMELQHGAAQLMARLNLGLGRAIVERIRFVQATPDEEPAPVRAAAGPVQAVLVAGITEGDLRDALGRLGGRIAAREPGGR